MGSKYVFTFEPRRRKRPSSEYRGFLKRYRLYIKYYSFVDKDPISAASGERQPKVALPIRFAEVVLNFSKEVGGRVIKMSREELRPGLSYDKPFVVLPNEISFQRHLLFSLISSTYRKPYRLNTIKSLVLTLNPFFLNVMTNVALQRYSLRKSGDPSWYQHMSRVGRAVKVLYSVE